MKKKDEKLAKYLLGTGQALVLLSKEISKGVVRQVTSEHLELMSRIGAELLFHSKSFDYLSD